MGLGFELATTVPYATFIITQTGLLLEQWPIGGTSTKDNARKFKVLTKRNIKSRIETDGGKTRSGQAKA